MAPASARIMPEMARQTRPRPWRLPIGSCNPALRGAAVPAPISLAAGYRFEDTAAASADEHVVRGEQRCGIDIRAEHAGVRRLLNSCAKV